MSVIGEIEIGMGVNLSKLSSGFQSAVGQTSSFASSVAGLAGPLAAVAGTGLSVAGLVSFTKSCLDSADAANDTAGRLGVATGELQKLRYAAQLTGTDTESLDNALGKMVLNLGDAATGSGTAAATLKTLGLDAKALARVDPSEAFVKLSGALAKVENPAQRAAFAMDLFGKGGLGVMNTLNAGPEKIAELTAEAERLGLAMSDADLEKVGAANDAIDRLGYAFTGLGNVLAVTVAPYLTSTLEAVVGWVEELHTGEGVVGAFGQVVGDVFNGMGVLFRNFGTFWEIAQLKATEAVGNVVALAATLPENFGRVFTWLGSNWLNLLRDMASAYATFITNAVKNAVSFGESIWRAMRGEGFTLELTPLLEGFEATAEALPEMVRPAWVDMSDEIGRLMEDVIDKETARAVEATGDAGRKIHGADKFLGGDKKGKGDKLAAAAEFGTKEAYSAIVKAQGDGPKSRHAADTAKATAATAKAAEETVAQLRRLNERPAYGVLELA